MNDAVEQIKSRLNIIDVITPYVPLQKAGKHFKACCPFHQEKTPSFNVSPERGMYHCYGCGAGGDIFTFVQAIEGVDFKEALKILAEKANVELKPVSPEKKSERDRLYEVMEEVTKYYESQLKQNQAAYQYVIDRGVIEATIGAWRIGFAPGPPSAGWTDTKDFMRAKGFTDTELIRAGLLKLSDKGKEPYDVFRNRIMFPIFDSSGRVVAFSGRTLEKDVEVPKYVNSPETDLFKKSEILYGYHKAKHGIRQLDFSMIVEGQFDVVMSHQAGYGNTVAVSGTALTAEHVKLLERLSNKVVLALDSDKAGLAAVRKGADLMLRRGLDVKVANLEGGKDPADLVKKDVKEFKKFIGHSVHVIDFLLSKLMAEGLDERTTKLRARDEILPYIILLPNYIDQDHFEGRVAETLGTTKDAIHFEVERLRELSLHDSEKSTSGTAMPVKTDIKNPDTKSRLDLDLIYLIGLLPLFPNETANKVKTWLGQVSGDGFEEMVNNLPAPSMAEVLFRAETFVDKNPRRVFEEEYIHKLNQYRHLTIKTKLKEAKEKQRQLEEVGDIEGAVALSSEIMTGQKELQETPLTRDFLKVN